MVSFAPTVELRAPAISTSLIAPETSGMRLRTSSAASTPQLVPFRVERFAVVVTAVAIGTSWVMSSGFGERRRSTDGRRWDDRQWTLDQLLTGSLTGS